MSTSTGGGIGGWVRAHRIGIAYAMVILACLLTLVVSMSAWVNRQLLDTDTWVEQSSAMLADDEVREVLAVRLVDAAYGRGDLEGRLADRLPPQLEPLAPQIAGALRPAAINLAEAILRRPAVQTLWEEANRRAHTRLVAILEGNEGRPITTADGEVVLDLRPIAAQLRSALGITAPVASDGVGTITIMQSDDLEAAQTAVQALKVVSLVAAVVVIALFVLGVWLGEGARRALVCTAGWGLIVVGLVLLIVRRVAGDIVIDSLARPDGETAARQVWVLATSIMRDLALGLIVFGIVALLWALLAGSSRLGVALRGRIAPVLAGRPVIAFGAVVLAFLILMLWSPVGAPRQLIGTLFILGAALVGTEALRRQVVSERSGSA